jgi:hypothetical protein
VAARCNACVCRRSLAGIVSSNPAGGRDVCLSVVSVVCCHKGSLRQADHSSRVVLQECGASECDHEVTVMRGLGPRGVVAPLGKGGGFKDFEYVVQYSMCVKEGSHQASWCAVLPSVTSRVHECSNVCFCVCAKCSRSCPYKTENKRNLNGINLNVILKSNLTGPQINGLLL